MVFELEGLIPNQTDENGVTFTDNATVTIRPSNITEDTLIYATVLIDPDPIFNFRGEESGYIIRDEESGYILRSEEGVAYLPYMDMSWTDTFGVSFLEPIFINL